MDEDQMKKLIEETFKSTQNYLTPSHVSQATGIPPQTVKEFLATHPKEFRQSQIDTNSGEDLFILNTPLSGIKDAWAAYRYMNSKKFF